MIAGPHATPLRLVHGVSLDRAWSDADPARSADRPRVLCQRTIERLRALNAVARRLRQWGYGIDEQLLDGPHGNPYIRITVPAHISIASLLDADPHHRWIPEDNGQSRLSALLDGVQVEWEAR